MKASLNQWRVHSVRDQPGVSDCQHLSAQTVASPGVELQRPGNVADRLGRWREKLYCLRKAPRPRNGLSGRVVPYCSPRTGVNEKYRAYPAGAPGDGEGHGIEHEKGAKRYMYPNGSAVFYLGVKDDESLERLKGIGLEGGIEFLWIEEANELRTRDADKLWVQLQYTRS